MKPKIMKTKKGMDSVSRPRHVPNRHLEEVGKYILDIVVAILIYIIVHGL